MRPQRRRRRVRQSRGGSVATHDGSGSSPGAAAPHVDRSERRSLRHAPTGGYSADCSRHSSAIVGQCAASVVPQAYRGGMTIDTTASVLGSFAEPAATAAHFAARLSFETDPSDVAAALGAGERILLVDVRGAEAWNQGHAVGALHLPRAGSTRDWVSSTLSYRSSSTAGGRVQWGCEGRPPARESRAAREGDARRV